MHLADAFIQRRNKSKSMLSAHVKKPCKKLQNTKEVVKENLLLKTRRTALIKRGGWSFICGTQTCRQACACTLSPPQNTLPQAFQPRPKVGQTAVWRLLNLWPSPTLTEPAQREGDRGEESQRPVLHTHTPWWVCTSTCLQCEWHVKTLLGALWDKLKRQIWGDAETIWHTQLPNPHIWLEL